jgi:hypothetical protein
MLLLHVKQSRRDKYLLIIAHSLSYSCLHCNDSTQMAGQRSDWSSSQPRANAQVGAAYYRRRRGRKKSDASRAGWRPQLQTQMVMVMAVVVSYREDSG